MNNPKKNKKEEKKKNKKKLLLLLLLLLLLFLLGWLVFKIGFNAGKSQKPVSPDPTPQRMVIAISDEEGLWKNSNGKGGSEEVNQINVFSVNTSARKYIAPYDKGVYEFDVKNTINKNIVYSLTLEEDNSDKVNIKYKLKKNGNYIMGEYNWLYYNEIHLEDVLLSSQATDSYELEWSWVSENDELDTKIGLKKDRALYNITIKVMAVEDVER